LWYHTGRDPSPKLTFRGGLFHGSVPATGGSVFFMKQLFLIVMALCVACTGIAAAEQEVPQADSGSFVFRDRITWGMSESEVTGLEGEGYQSEEQDGVRLIYYPAVRLGAYEAHLVYAFASDRLRMAFYGFDHPDQEMFDSLKLICSRQYGEEKETAPEELWALMDGLKSGAFDPETVKEWEYSRWDAPEGTAVWLVWEKHGDVFRIEEICVSPEEAKTR